MCISCYNKEENRIVIESKTGLKFDFQLRGKN